MKYKSKKVEVSLVFKPQKKQEKKEKAIDEFLDKWFGYFPEIETDDVRYNAIMEKHK